MKKIDRAKLFIQNNMEIFRCPFCQNKITSLQDNSIVCINGHVINLNKKGTLHLLTHGVESDYDNKELWNARRTLLQAGLFSPIIEQIMKELPAKKLKIIDVGCGEGTPLINLARSREKYNDILIGFDISKDAINLATQNELHPFFCIADLANLPFMDNSIDAIIDIFSPSSYGEFLRVLKNEGKLYKVIPNANYLIELRHLLYGDTGSRKSSYSNDKVLNLFSKHFPNFESKRIRYKFNLTPENFKNLLLMTPLSWGASNEQLEYSRQNPLNEITVDVTLLIA